MGLTGGLAVIAAVQISLAQSTAPQQSPAIARQLPRTPMTLRVGPQRPDLVRYNRVEGLSLGLRAQARPESPLGPLSLSAIARIGTADWHPEGRLDIADETVDRRVVLSGYHELAPIDERARHLGVANSLMALLSGRDDGDYYRRSGARLVWTPPTSEPRSYRFRVIAEYHEAVAKETDASLPSLWNDDQAFRANLAADDGWEYGGSLELTSRSNTDPGRSQGGVRAFVQAGTGDTDYARASFAADLELVLPFRLRLIVEGEGGTSWGSPSAQRLWYLGGPLTLRGFAPTALGGRSFGRTRVEVDRAFSFGRLVVFSDAGWAGDHRELEVRDAVSSAGAGLAVLDGILRVDGAWQLQSPNDFRLDIYLDQIL